MKIQKSEIMKSAWEKAKKTKISFAEALRQAWLLAKTSTYEFFEIEFVKKSTGEITRRLASNGKQKNDLLLFFSISDNGFRSAVIDNILSIQPIEGRLTFVGGVR